MKCPEMFLCTDERLFKFSVYKLADFLPKALKTYPFLLFFSSICNSQPLFLVTLHMHFPKYWCLVSLLGLGVFLCITHQLKKKSISHLTRGKYTHLQIHSHKTFLFVCVPVCLCSCQRFTFAKFMLFSLLIYLTAPHMDFNTWAKKKKEVFKLELLLL